MVVKQNNNKIHPEPLQLPRHIAIIMDGNGRWAQRRGLLRHLGHRHGMDALRQSVELCRELNVEILTVYAFSLENWKRPREEVDFLMNLVVEYLDKEEENLHRQGIRINPIGELDYLPLQVRARIEQAVSHTAANSDMIFNIAISYSSRREIVTAARILAAQAATGCLDPQDIDEERFASALYTSGQIDPDLMIRPSGEQRISNFLLWQSAYTEFYYTDIFWPDFGKKDLQAAIAAYQRRERRYGQLTMDN
ncbi:MAG: isoprenyl transferase [Clostridiales bacterium]|jgi:undecaprenyl diphosphate synthase|nr:isoprenyl transferase [Clostridiales bacterium]